MFDSSFGTLQETSRHPYLKRVDLGAEWPCRLTTYWQRLETIELYVLQNPLCCHVQDQEEAAVLDFEIASQRVPPDHCRQQHSVMSVESGG